MLTIPFLNGCVGVLKKMIPESGGGCFSWMMPGRKKILGKNKCFSSSFGSYMIFILKIRRYFQLTNNKERNISIRI